MTEFERFDRNARFRGVLIDTNLFVLFIVGAVNRDRIAHFKRTRNYTPADWDLLIGLFGRIPRRYALPHVLAEVSTLTDMKGPELIVARDMLRKTISLTEELPISSLQVCASTFYGRLGLTDAAIALAVKERGCSVVSNDSGLYVALLEQGTSVLKFDHLRDAVTS